MLHHVGVVDQQFAGGGDRGLGDIGDAVLAVHDTVGQRADPDPVLLGDTHQLGDDVHGQLAREFVDEVECGALQGGVQVLVGDLGDPALELADAPRGEALGHQRAQPEVTRIVERQERHHAMCFVVA